MDNVSTLNELLDTYYIADAKLHQQHMQRLAIADQIEGANNHPSYQGLVKLQADERSALAEQVFGGHFLRQAEIETVVAGRPRFALCVERYLREFYGQRVSFLAGVGWFLDRPEASTRPVQLSLVTA